MTSETKETVTVTLDRKDAEILVAGSVTNEALSAAYGRADLRLVAAMRAALDQETKEPQQTTEPEPTIKFCPHHGPRDVEGAYCEAPLEGDEILCDEPLRTGESLPWPRVDLWRFPGQWKIWRMGERSSRDRSEVETYVPLSELTEARSTLNTIRSWCDDPPTEMTGGWLLASQVADLIDGVPTSQSPVEEGPCENCGGETYVDRAPSTFGGQPKVRYPDCSPVEDVPKLHGHNRTLADVREWIAERKASERRDAPTNQNTPAAGTPTEIAHGAMDRLCDYDAWDAPGAYDSTADRIGEFMREFVGIAAARLAGAVMHGEGTPVADAQEYAQQQKEEKP